MMAAVGSQQVGCSYIVALNISYLLQAQQEQQTDEKVHYLSMLAGRLLMTSSSSEASTDSQPGWQKDQRVGLAEDMDVQAIVEEEEALMECLYWEDSALIESWGCLVSKSGES
jgi:hypothetical protein